MALAIYRKYRPKTLSDLLGQETNTEILKNAAKADKLAHAYLLYGPRGSGKTSAARILAKIANCEKRRDDKKFLEVGEPCNKCATCLEIDSGRSLDVIEIDAASNRGIDEIRELKEGIKISPISSRYKVFIIDEVHMLTREAFNALLKTLEEPPAHAIFILATTESEKLPITITSRTQRFAFKKLSRKQISEKLSTIAKAENFSADKEALELIASSAGGSLRDAESLLDQITASFDSGKKAELTLELAEKVIGKVSIGHIDEFVGLIFKNDLDATLKHLSKIDESGYNLVQFTKDLIHYLRRVLTIKVSPQIEEVFLQELSEDEVSRIKKHAESIDVARQITLIKSLITAYSEMRYSPFAIVPLEVAIIENLKSK